MLKNEVKDYRDPREQAVILRHPKCPPATLMAAEDYFSLPRPLSTDPIHVQAIKGELDHDACSGCGEPMHLHYDLSGLFLIGCEGAMRRRQLGLAEGPREYINGDQHPVVAQAIRSHLFVACGTLSGVYAELRQDEQIQIARELATYAVRAYLLEMGK